MPEAERKKDDVSAQISSLSVQEAIRYLFSLPPRLGSGLILGPPGIGKTEGVIQAAEEEAKRLGKKFVVLNEERARRSHSEFVDLVRDIYVNPDKYYVAVVVSFGAVNPEDLMGVPSIETIRFEGDDLIRFESSAMKLSLSLLTISSRRGRLRRAESAGGYMFDVKYTSIYGLLLIDDALNANDNVRRSFLQAAMKERIVGGFDGALLSRNVRVIATGNLTEHSDLVTPLPKPMVGRAPIFIVEPEPLEKWYSNMVQRYGDGWDRDVYAFLSRYKSMYMNLGMIEDEAPRGPTPRSWTLLALSLHESRDLVERLIKSGEVDKLTAIVEAYIGRSAAMQFVAFKSKPVISVDEALANPGRIDAIAGDLDLVFRFAMQVADRINTEAGSGGGRNIAKYLGLVAKLMDKVSDDIGAFIYGALTDQAKASVRRFVLRPGPGKEERKIAGRIRDMIIKTATASVLSE